MLSINRLPAPHPSPSHWLCKLGWSLVLILGLLAVFLTLSYFNLAGNVKYLDTEVALSRIEAQSLQQQLEAERILAARQIADSPSKSTPEPLTITRLSSPDSSDTRLKAIIIWRTASQTGVFFAEKLPPPAADKEYRLWIEADDHSPISSGEIRVATNGPTQLGFNITEPIGQPKRFTVTCENKDNTTLSPVVIVLTGTP